MNLDIVPRPIPKFSMLHAECNIGKVTGGRVWGRGYMYVYMYVVSLAYSYLLSG